VESTTSDEGISTEGMIQSQPRPTNPETWFYGTTDRRSGSGHLKSVRTTDNI